MVLKSNGFQNRDMRLPRHALSRWRFIARQ